MAITSELIGKLGGGGAEVEATPVSGAASGGINSEIVLHTVQVPPGETWLIAAIGNLSASSSNNLSAPKLYLGNQESNGFAAKGTLSMAALGEGTVTFRINRKYGGGTDAFTGHVYTVKM